jgi:hypothetical protein
MKVFMFMLNDWLFAAGAGAVGFVAGAGALRGTGCGWP